MSPRFHHPFWTHLPAVALALVNAVLFWRAWPLPDPAPVHFGGDGTPDRFGAPWEMPLVVLLACAVAILVSFAIDELFARQERRKRFNLLSLVDELFVAFQTALTLQYLDAMARTPPVLEHSWTLPAALAAVALTGGVVLERLRPHRPRQETLLAEEGPDLARAVRARQQSGQPWAYWESQNPRHARWLLPAFGLGLLVLGYQSWGDNRLASVAAGAAGLLVLLTASGGFRVTVTPERLRLCSGLAGLPLLRIPMEEIQTAESHHFSPLADFRGWGIRRNREMLAFFLEGTTGVKVTTTKGKRYLIGTATPERLASVIRAARGG
jgi:hypothetical protein